MWHWLKHVLLSMLAVFLVLEEWLWDVLTLFGRWLFKLLHLARFEFWLTQCSPWVALISFLIPLAVVMPINVAALILLSKGKVLRAIGLEIVAKLLGIVLVARVFALTRRQLMSYAWFSWLYGMIMRALAWAHDRLSSTAAYRVAHNLKARLMHKKRPGE